MLFELRRTNDGSIYLNRSSIEFGNQAKNINLNEYVMPFIYICITDVYNYGFTNAQTYFSSNKPNDVPACEWCTVYLTSYLHICVQGLHDNGCKWV